MMINEVVERFNAKIGGALINRGLHFSFASEREMIQRVGHKKLIQIVSDFHEESSEDAVFEKFLDEMSRISDRGVMLYSPFTRIGNELIHIFVVKVVDSEFGP